MKKVILVLIIVVMAMGITGFFAEPTKEKTIVVFHATLADPNLYSDGIYSERFFISAGDYSFRFVPNGSSPRILAIVLSGDNFKFDEEFTLEETVHRTEISEYSTWEYRGNGNIHVYDEQELSITINPNGNIMGSLTVDIIEK